MRKVFQHYFVDKIELTEETLENGTRYYTIPSGEKFKSVTTILSERGPDQKWLMEWRRRVGETKAKEISRQAIRRGKAIHNICEHYVMNINPYIPEDLYSMSSLLYEETFNPIKKVLDNHVDTVYGVELPLYSKALATAGRSDLVAQYEGVNSIIDYKTSKKIKSERNILNYFLQSCVYSLMFERMYKISVPQIVIIMTVDGETEPLVFVKDRSKYINQVLEIFLP